MIAEPPSDSPAPRINGQRAFRGKPQLTSRERTVLDQISRSFLGVVYHSGQPEFYCPSCKDLRRNRVERFIRLGYLAPQNDGLPFGAPQTYRVLPASSWPRAPP
jgi:hypothetical protein